jgi:flagellar basal-body rod protein FlgB
MSVSVSPIHLFDIASQQAHWLSVRQATIATNIANANTPAFVARDVQPFANILDKTQLSMAVTDPRHVALTDADVPTAAVKPADAWETTKSGNSVSVEQEMMKSGEVNRSFSLNANIIKAFNNMLLAAVKV